MRRRTIEEAEEEEEDEVKEEIYLMSHILFS
jgi:hypothetical protein